MEVTPSLIWKERLEFEFESDDPDSLQSVILGQPFANIAGLGIKGDTHTSDLSSNLTIHIRSWHIRILYR